MRWIEMDKAYTVKNIVAHFCRTTMVFWSNNLQQISGQFLSLSLILPDIFSIEISISHILSDKLGVIGKVFYGAKYTTRQYIYI
jgi:hypothetical protein